MHTITAIEPQSKNPRRVNLYLDGEFALGIANILVAWLKVGQQISDEKLAVLQNEDVFETMKQKSLHFMGYRLRSCEEVRRNLISHKCGEKMVEEIIQYHQQSGLLDDQEFACAWVENRNTFRQRSKSVLRLELLRKGISEEIIQTVLDETTDDQTLALEAARKQARRYASLEWYEFRQKLGGFLARRGFSYATLSPIVSQVWEEFQLGDSGRTKEIEEKQDE
jgi:regulatory protein